MARLISLALILGLAQNGLAGPACAEKHKTASDCMQRCSLKWGYPGLMMGTDPWGTVMHKTGDDSDDAWNEYLALACGETVTSSSATQPLATSLSVAPASKLIHQGLGTQSVSSASSTAASSTHISSSSRFSSSRLTTSTTTHSTTSTTKTSTKPTTTSTSSSKAQLAKVTQAPPPPPTTTHTTTQAAPTTTAQSNSNSNSNSDSGNSDSGNSDSGDSASANSGSSSGSGGNGSRASDSDVQAYLQTHNSIRSQHGAVPVTWSNDAAEKAQEWADECKNVHSGGTLGPLGENLAAGTGSFSIQAAVKAWTDEVSEYDASNPQPSHFTQVVWKATTQIGCAVQTCDGIFAGFGAAQYYVCEYSVQGNVIGHFGDNVQA
ncbi:PR-1-like protein [Mycena polygramma]|nr:PR-1-like protein [Mycena polygramma]